MKWYVDFVGPDGEDYTKSLDQGNVERDGRFRRIIATLEANDGDPVDARWMEVGKRLDLGAPAK